MGTELITQKYEEEIHGVLNCYDRVVISGNLQRICYAKGMTSYLYQEQIRVFDYTKFAEPMRNEVRENAEKIAAENGLSIEFIRKKGEFRKEARVKEVLQERGSHEGLVHIFSAMEGCQAYKPWHNKKTHKTYVKRTTGKCLHYYFYFIDAQLGLCYMRVPTWCPFRLQFYFNGHNALAMSLAAAQIPYEQLDNAFLRIADFDRANELAASFDMAAVQQKLDQLAQIYCPAVEQLGLAYNWSIMQAEYATDVVFKNQLTLQAFYPHLLETLIHVVKPSDIATFLGRKLSGNYQDEMGNRFNKRWLGTRIKHQMGPVTLKMYDKFNIILRIETTVNNVSFFPHYRQVQHRDGTTSMRFAPMKKTIYSLPALAETALAVNKRYLKFLSDIETPEVGVAKLQQLTQTQTDDNGRRYKGFNLLSEEDSSFFRLLNSGDFVIHGFANKTLRQQLPDKNSGQLSRLLRRLRQHGLIKRVQKSYRYYLTDFGRHVSLLAIKLREIVVIPSLASNPA